MIAFIGNQISEKHMNKRIKWGIILTIGIGLSGLGIYQFTPHENEELTAADALPRENKSKTLKVNAQVITPHLLTDEILVTGRLVPDEEVNLSFIIRKSKFPQNPKRSVRFSGKRTKRSVQKRKARNTQKAETKVL